MSQTKITMVFDEVFFSFINNNMQQLPERTISFLKLSEKQRKYIIKWMSKVYTETS